MIVLHGVAALAEEISAYTLLMDNKGYDFTLGTSPLQDSIISSVEGRAKTDGTAMGGGATIKVKIKTSNVSSMMISSAYCQGESNTLMGIEGGALTKEDYLSEVYAFSSTGRVDFSLSSVGYESPLDGAVFGSWVSESMGEESTGANVSLKKTGEDEFTLEYNTMDVVKGKIWGDWYVVTGINLKLNVITKSGGIAAGESVTYYNDDAPISSVVNMSGEKYLTFDSGIAVMGGWWETSEVQARRRVAAKTGISTRESMFRYLIFGSISPRVFSTSIRNMIFTARRSDNTYTMDKVLSNNTYERPSLGGLSISSSGPELTGAASIFTHEDIGAISINTVNAETSFGEMHIEISDPESINTCKFQIKSGHGPSGNFIGAAVGAPIVYNQITGPGTTSIASTNANNQLIGFHLFINGLQEYLLGVSWSPLDLAMMIITRGISCVLSGNMIDLAFFLLYENIKSIIWDTEGKIIIDGIMETQEYYLSSMTHAQQGIDASTRKKIARQWLEMVDTEYMKKSGPMIHRTFFFQFMCVFIPFDFPDSLPYSLGMPMYGVPMEEDVAGSADIEDQIMTDELLSMMKKNAQFTMYRSRVDWAMFMRGRLSEVYTSWAWGGTLVTVTKNGRHQELYSATDPAYGLNSTEHTSSVSIPGEIGEKWNEYRGAMIPAHRFVKWSSPLLENREFAEISIERWGGKSIPASYGLTNSMLIDLDHDTVSQNGNEPIDAIIKRPNASVILAFKKIE